MSIPALPGVDLAPSVTSRIVSIDAVTLTEGAPVSGDRAWVEFTLPVDLNVKADGKIIAASTIRVPLKDGKAQVRLPTYDADALTVAGDRDWGIIVRKGWATGSPDAWCGSTRDGAYLIRVPEGSATIPLAALPAVRPLRGREKQFALTGVGVTVKEGPQWDATATLNGGVLNLAFTVPPGGTAWFKGALGSAHLDTVTEPGQYIQAYQSGATTDLAYPVAQAGALLVTAGGVTVTQTFTTVQGIWQRQRYNNSWGDWTRLTSTITNRGLLGATDLDTVSGEGTWYQLYQGNATSGNHYPISQAGQLEVRVLNAATGIWSQTYWPNDSDTWGVWRRVRANGAWGPWARVTSTIKNRGLLGSRDLDTVLDEGTWYQAYSSFADMTGAMHYPEKSAGQLEVRNLNPATGTHSQTYYSSSSGTVWRRVSSGSVWGEWQQAGGGSVSTGDVSVERAVRVDQARARAGGKVGTAGRGVIALRFDDAADAMNNVIMPRLRARGLVAGWAATVRLPEQESTQTWETIAGWASDGVEMLGHSWTHQDATGAGLRKELVDSADYVEGKTSVSIDTWVMPGTGAGDATYDGFGTGSDLTKYRTTQAGALLLSRYAVVDGGTPGAYRPLAGHPRIGASHITFEAMTLADTKAAAQKAIDTGTGLVLMAHPSRFGTDGYMSLADLDALLDWLAGERDAERLEVLTPRALAYADASTGDRYSVTPTALTAWDTTTGWTTTTGGVATTISGAGLSHTVKVSTVGMLKGGVLEAVALVKSDSSSPVAVAVSGAVTKTKTVTIGTTWTWVRVPFALPLTSAWDASLTVTISRRSGGRVSVAYAAVRPS